MLRFLILTLISIFILSVFRMIVGALSKNFGEMMKEEKEKRASAGSDRVHPASPPPPPRPGPGASGGELKRDPVCGTFVPVGSAVTRVVNGSPLYFCSPECRDKYSA